MGGITIFSLSFALHALILCWNGSISLMCESAKPTWRHWEASQAQNDISSARPHSFSLATFLFRKQGKEKLWHKNLLSKASQIPGHKTKCSHHKMTLFFGFLLVKERIKQREKCRNIELIKQINIMDRLSISPQKCLNSHSLYSAIFYMK